MYTSMQCVMWCVAMVIYIKQLCGLHFKIKLEVILKAYKCLGLGNQRAFIMSFECYGH